MTVQQIIKQTETFTPEQKQQLAYYFLFSTLNEDKKQNLLQLFNIKNGFEVVHKKSKTDLDIEKMIDEICGSGKNLWNEDAQVYINKLREDDRIF